MIRLVSAFEPALPVVDDEGAGVAPALAPGSADFFLRDSTSGKADPCITPYVPLRASMKPSSLKLDNDRTYSRGVSMEVEPGELNKALSQSDCSWACLPRCWPCWTRPSRT